MEAAARFVILVGLVLLVAALADLMLRDRSVVKLGEPRWNGERVESLAVELPPIREFTYYYGGDEDAWRHRNPFVPYNKRRAERERLESNKPRTRIDDGDVIASVDPRVNQVEIEIPDLELPTLDETRKIKVPEVLGRMGLRGRTHLLVRYDGKTWRMSPGERLDTWTLDGIDQGEAVFLDEHGEIWRVRIGQSDDPVVNRLGGQVGGGDDAGSSDDAGGGDGDAAVMALKRKLGAALKKRDIAAMQRLVREADPELVRALKEDPEVRQLLASPIVEQLLKQRPRTR